MLPIPVLCEKHIDIHKVLYSICLNTERAHYLKNYQVQLLFFFFTDISVKTSIYYCSLRTSKKTTTIQKRHRNPVFNETFEFQLSKDRIAECDVLFEIRHHGPMNRTVIGYVIVGHSAGGEGSKQWKQLLDFSYHEQNYKILPNKPVGLR